MVKPPHFHSDLAPTGVGAGCRCCLTAVHRGRPLRGLRRRDGWAGGRRAFKTQQRWESNNGVYRYFIYMHVLCMYAIQCKTIIFLWFPKVFRQQKLRCLPSFEKWDLNLTQEVVEQMRRQQLRNCPTKKC